MASDPGRGSDLLVYILHRYVLSVVMRGTTALEQKHIAELKEAFQYIDHDGDGIIDAQDLNELLPSIGISQVC